MLPVVPNCKMRTREEQAARICSDQYRSTWWREKPGGKVVQDLLNRTSAFASYLVIRKWRKKKAPWVGRRANGPPTAWIQAFSAGDGSGYLAAMASCISK